MNLILPFNSASDVRGLPLFWSVLGALILGVTGACAAENAYPNQPLEPPKVRTFPAKASTIQRWIDSLDLRKIRAHGWDVWESITRPSGESDYPIWETWHSGHELFEMSSEGDLGTGPKSRSRARGFELPTQFVHAHRARLDAGNQVPVDGSERVLSFNRYSPSLARTIWDRRLNIAATLNATNALFDRLNTPVAARSISTSRRQVDARSICLKPVFQFIDGSKPSVIPYWSGISPQTTTHLQNPEPHTWRQAVLVDPTGKLPPGSLQRATVNGEPNVEVRVVPLRHFYSVRINQAEVEHFTQFGAGSGDDLGRGILGDTNSIAAMVRPGNIALLVAMHVTTKEITNWTWQSFYWTPRTDDPLVGADRPRSMGEPWSHYNQVSAYFMTPRNEPKGQPWVAFNPYLETDLSGTAKMPGGVQVAWTGVDSNCMSCHRMAAWKPKPGGVGISTPGYVPNGFIDPADEFFFGGFTKLDFLWSLTRAK
jgi:hypothetical protein